MITLTKREMETWKPLAAIVVETGELIQGAVMHDGLLMAFDYRDVKDLLDMYYPKKDAVYYFNVTQDREIGELSYGEFSSLEQEGKPAIIVNPAFYRAHLS